MWIFRFLLVFLLIGCTTTRVIEKTKYVQKTVALDSLKAENHLLRVEIDHLKSEQKKIQELIEINEAAKKLKKNLSNLKEEICE
ncbi:MAG TPA: hypothetical protein VFM82_05805 [Flavobacteriaceae bacterium]|nr:hypothetical protein [Flavobacteriaceae bacterium]